MSIKLVYQSIFSNPGNKGKYFQKLLKAIFWQINKRTFKRNYNIRLKNGIFFKTYTDCVISSSLIYSDFPEYQEIKYLRNNLQKDDCVIDIGANVGHLSLLVADLVKSENLYLFEPAPESFKRLSENWKMNGFKTDNLFQLAVGSESKVVYIKNTNNPLTTNSVSAHVIDDEHIEIKQIRLDEYSYLWKDKNIGLLKIDVEGYEKEVIKGASKLIKEKQPKIIMFESLEDTVDPEIKNLFEKLSYKIFSIDKYGKVNSENLKSQNLFAVPE